MRCRTSLSQKKGSTLLSFAVAMREQTVVGHLVVLTCKLSVRTDRVRTSKKQVCEKWTLTTLTILRFKFPVAAHKFPVIRNIFPVNLHRELCEKSLRHSGFLL
jgi:hypothetical protein